jgi:hypothetical protein
MCPACLVSAVWVIGGVLSASGAAIGIAAAALPLPAGKGTRRIPSGEVKDQDTKEKEKASWQRQ